MTIDSITQAKTDVNTAGSAAGSGQAGSAGGFEELLEMLFGNESIGGAFSGSGSQTSDSAGDSSSGTEFSGGAKTSDSSEMEKKSVQPQMQAILAAGILAPDMSAPQTQMTGQNAAQNNTIGETSASAISCVSPETGSSSSPTVLNRQFLPPANSSAPLLFSSSVAPKSFTAAEKESAAEDSVSAATAQSLPVLKQNGANAAKTPDELFAAGPFSKNKIEAGQRINFSPVSVSSTAKTYSDADSKLITQAAGSAETSAAAKEQKVSSFAGVQKAILAADEPKAFSAVNGQKAMSTADVSKAFSTAGIQKSAANTPQPSGGQIVRRNSVPASPVLTVQTENADAADSFHSVSDETDSFQSVLSVSGGQAGTSIEVNVAAASVSGATAEPLKTVSADTVTETGVKSEQSSQTRSADFASTMAETPQTQAGSTSNVSAKAQDSARQSNSDANTAGQTKADVKHADSASPSIKSYQNAASAAAAAAAPKSGLVQNAANTEKSSVVSQTAQAVVKAAQSGKTQLSVHMTPENLGGITIKMVSQSGSLSVRIIADNSDTGRLIAGGLQDIKNAVAAQGVAVGKTEVVFSGGNFSGNSHQNPGGFGSGWAQDNSGGSRQSSYSFWSPHNSNDSNNLSNSGNHASSYENETTASDASRTSRLLSVSA